MIIKIPKDKLIMFNYLLSNAKENIIARYTETEPIDTYDEKSLDYANELDAETLREIKDLLKANN